MKNYKNYRGADKSLARPISLCILFDGENISFDASLIICVCIYLFSWRYSPLGCTFDSPVAGFSLLILEVSRSHTTTRHSR